MILCLVFKHPELLSGSGHTFDSATFSFCYKKKVLDTLTHDEWLLDSVLFLEFHLPFSVEDFPPEDKAAIVPTHAGIKDLKLIPPPPRISSPVRPR